jgi:hypothetical protein
MKQLCAATHESGNGTKSNGFTDYTVLPGDEFVLSPSSAD